MKTILLFALFLFVSCSGGGEGKTSAAKVSSGNVTEEKALKDYIHQSIQTLPSELKLSTNDKTYLKTELDLTQEELLTLEQLQ